MELNEVEEDILEKIRGAVELGRRESSLKCTEIQKKYEILQEKYRESKQQLQDMKVEMGQLRKQLYGYIRKEQVSSPILDDRNDQHSITDYFQTSKGILTSIKLEPDNERNNSGKTGKELSRKYQTSSSPMKSDDNIFLSPNKRLKFQSFSGISPNKRKLELKSKSFAHIPFDKLPTQYSDDESTQSSPIRVSPRRNNLKKSEVNSSQKSRQSIKLNSSPAKLMAMGFNASSEKLELIPDTFGQKPPISESSPEKPPSSPNKVAESGPTSSVDCCFNSHVSVHSEVSDSQEDDEDEITTSSLIVIPQPNLHTTLQNREYIRKYLQEQYGENGGKISLGINPINQSNWIISDFKPNPNFQKQNYKLVNVGNTTIKRKIGLNQADEDNIQTFYRKLNNGPSDPTTNYEDEVSQFYDKFQSPPGFMQSEFPNTQELQRRKLIIESRQSKRIKRRIRACLQVEENMQIGEFIFTHDVLNKYIVNNRYVYQE